MLNFMEGTRIPAGDSDFRSRTRPFVPQAQAGLAPNEAARVVGCSTAAYFVRLHRARRRL